MQARPDDYIAPSFISSQNHEFLTRTDSFEKRHIGTTGPDLAPMLKSLQVTSVDHLIEQTIPEQIHRKTDGYSSGIVRIWLSAGIKRPPQKPCFPQPHGSGDILVP